MPITNFIQLRSRYFRLQNENLNTEVHETTRSPVVTYGSGTWSLTLREEHVSMKTDPSADDKI